MQNFTSVDCAFADEGEDPISMIEEVEDTIENTNSYYIGGRRSVKKTDIIIFLDIHIQKIINREN